MAFSRDWGVPCARVIEYDDASLALERLDAAAPRAPRHTNSAVGWLRHDSGADLRLTGRRVDRAGVLRPAAQSAADVFAGHDRWGVFFARERLAPMAERAAHAPERAGARGRGHGDGPVRGRCLRRRRPAGPAARRFVERERDVDT